jgi:hypothetical protein
MAPPTSGLLLLAAHASCGSSSVQPTLGGAHEGGAPAAEANGGASDDGGATVQLTWVVDLSPNPGTGFGDGSAAPVDAGEAGIRPQAVAGVKVCAMGHPEIACAMTASDGTFTITGLTPVANVALTFEKPGYLSLIKPVQMGRMDEQSTVPVLMSRSADPEPDLGFPIDLQTLGSVQFFVISFAGSIPDAGASNLFGFSAVPGVTVSMAPPSGKGPYYVDNYNQVARDAGSTIGYNTLYFNVAPGDYTASVDDPNDNCAAISFTFASSGYPVLSRPHTVAFPVVAGHTDAVGVLCTRNARLVDVDGG